jgi:hypothetical protein
LRRFFTLPFTDSLGALDRGITAHGLPAMLVVAAGCVAGWWIYVPIHELMHAWGCLLGGGSVTQLDIAAGYGGSLLQRVFPYVHVGSEYAGQLSGFDTRDNDAIYALTVFFPYVLTVLLGVPGIVYVARMREPGMRSLLLLGVALPVAWAPIISLTGDLYELGSILMSAAARTGLHVEGTAAWRSDDLFKLARHLFGGSTAVRASDVAGIAASFTLGTVLGFATYAAGRWCARCWGMRDQPDPQREE